MRFAPGLIAFATSCVWLVNCALPSGLSGGEGPAAPPASAADEGGAGSARDGGEDEGAPSPGNGSDAGKTDAPDGGPPAPNLLSNADFSLGCAGWEVLNGTAATSSVARSGSSSCQVCGTGAYLEFSQEVDLKTASGQEYYGEIWVRSSSGTEPPLGLSVLNEYPNGSNEDAVVTTGPTVTSTWTQVTALLTTHTAGVGVSLDFVVTDSASHCYFVDDAVISRLR